MIYKLSQHPDSHCDFQHKGFTFTYTYSAYIDTDKIWSFSVNRVYGDGENKNGYADFIVNGVSVFKAVNKPSTLDKDYYEELKTKIDTYIDCLEQGIVNILKKRNYRPPHNPRL